ncbi:unnamed protein product [Effrenium voratum]|nr:unnamed protein product [Effrenium voratum]
MVDEGALSSAKEQRAQRFGLPSASSAGAEAGAQRSAGAGASGTAAADKAKTEREEGFAQLLQEARAARAERITATAANRQGMVTEENGNSLSTKEKLDARAKRFGGSASTAVAEGTDIKAARAQRFGTAVADDAKKKEARVERFGTATATSVSGPGEDDKKAKRGQRFGTGSAGASNASVSSANVGASEEEARKRRAERFATALGAGSAERSVGGTAVKGLTADRLEQRKQRFAGMGSLRSEPYETGANGSEDQKKKQRAERFKIK